jgi:hypothetical protein
VEIPIAQERLKQFRNGMRFTWRLPTPADQVTQRSLYMQYRQLATDSPDILPDLRDTYFRAYSQNGEDGILLFLFAVLGATTRISVEICAADGIQCNSANLIINHGWDGLLVDGNERLVERGRKFYASCPDTLICPPIFRHAWVTAENVNELVASAGFGSEVDLLSLDLDGVDYWIWKALDAISPRVVVVEYQDIWGPTESKTVPYRPDFSGDAGFNYQGASLLAFVKLAREKGYRLVGTERLGFNAFFVREDVGAHILPAVDHNDSFAHRKVREGMKNRLWQVNQLEWVDV